MTSIAHPQNRYITGTSAVKTQVGHVVRDANGVIGQVVQDDAWFCGEPAICVRTQQGQFLMYHPDALEVLGVMEPKKAS